MRFLLEEIDQGEILSNVVLIIFKVKYLLTGNYGMIEWELHIHVAW